MFEHVTVSFLCNVCCHTFLICVVLIISKSSSLRFELKRSSGVLGIDLVLLEKNIKHKQKKTTKERIKKDIRIE